MTGRRALCLAAAAGMVVALMGCAAGSRPPPPTPLEPITVTSDAALRWSTQLGSITHPARVDTAGRTFYVSSTEGAVAALALEDGRPRWRLDAGRLSAGVGSDGRFSAVVTRDGTLRVYETGQPRWTQALPAPVSTAPFVAGERVFIQSIDRAIHAFDALDGSRLWTLPRGGEALSLIESGVIAAVGDTLLVGQGGRLLALDPLNGRVRWTVVVSNPRGTNELERLVDLVGRVGRVGDDVCVRAYQSAVACIDGRAGTLLWSRAANGRSGLDADAERVYAVQTNGQVVAYRRVNGEVLWDTDRFLFRGLGTPLVVGNSLLVGDSQGYVHVLDVRDGTPVGRLATDGSAIVGQPARIDDTAVFTTSRGGVYAVRVP